jgi:soluble lytic murein transglycosylase
MSIMKMRPKTKFYIATTILLLVLVAFFLTCLRVQRAFFPVKYRSMIKRHAEEYDLDPLLIAAIIYRESRYKQYAVSRSSARGLMQIMPATGDDIAEKLNASDYSTKDLFDPEINVRFGCYYLASVKRDFASDLTLTLAGYNSGPENVRKWLKKSGNSSENLTEDYPFTETRNYVISIRKVYWILRFCDKLISI